MTNNEIRQSINKFKDSLNGEREHYESKEREFNDLKDWFKEKFGPDKISSLTKDDILTFGKKIDKKWKGNRGEGFWRPSLRSTQWEDMLSDINKFRKTIKFLLYGKGDAEERLKELQIKEGPYNILTLAGKTMVVATAFLVVQQPEKFVAVLSISDKKNILQKLDRLPQDLPTDEIGKQFMILNDTLLKFKEEFDITGWNNYYTFTRFLWDYVRMKK